MATTSQALSPLRALGPGGSIMTVDDFKLHPAFLESTEKKSVFKNCRVLYAALGGYPACTPVAIFPALWHLVDAVVQVGRSLSKGPGVRPVRHSGGHCTVSGITVREAC